MVLEPCVTNGRQLNEFNRLISLRFAPFSRSKHIAPNGSGKAVAKPRLQTYSAFSSIGHYGINYPPSPRSLNALGFRFACRNRDPYHPAIVKVDFVRLTGQTEKAI